MLYTAKWLITHGFDGLYDTCPDNDECGCTVSELYPCDKEWRHGRKCRPGVKINDGTWTLIGPKEK
jgi:hypothetical protein